MSRSVLMMALALALGATRAESQLAWDAPSMLGPHSPQGISVLLIDPSPGGGPGVLGHWRRDTASLGMAYRLGLAENGADDLSVFGGVDLSGVLANGIEDADIRVLWWTGAGAGIGDDLVISLPAGLVLGWSGLGDGSVFAPYAGAHVVLDLWTGEGDNLELDGVVDLGLDLTLASGWVVRVGAALGGREALAVGIRLPT